MKKPLSIQQISEIKHHLTANIYPPLTDFAQGKIIAELNYLRAGKKTLEDEVNTVILGDLIEDLKLQDYL